MRYAILNLILLMTCVVAAGVPVGGTVASGVRNLGTVTIRQGETFDVHVKVYDCEKGEKCNPNDSNWGGLISLSKPVYAVPDSRLFTTDAYEPERWTCGDPRTRPNHSTLNFIANGGFRYAPRFYEWRYSIVDNNNIETQCALYVYVAEQTAPSITF